MTYICRNTNQIKLNKINNHIVKYAFNKVTHNFDPNHKIVNDHKGSNCLFQKDQVVTWSTMNFLFTKKTNDIQIFDFYFPNIEHRFLLSTNPFCQLQKTCYFSDRVFKDSISSSCCAIISLSSKVSRPSDLHKSE